MAFKIFLDANVCLDLLLRRENYIYSKRIFERISSGEFRAFITPSIVHIVAYILPKYYDKSLIKNIVLDLLNHVQVIDCSHEITINAVNSQMTDIEDALQYYTAMHHKVDYFISLDKKLANSAIPILPVYSPEEFLKEL